MSLTSALHRSLVSRATGVTDSLALDAILSGERVGVTFLYPGVSGGSRTPGSYRKAHRADLLTRQGGLCPVCGNVAEFPEFNHVVSRGPNVLGFLPGNLFAGCATCNLRCAYLFGTVSESGRVLDGGIIPLSHFARPDLIPTEWTAPPVLKAMQRTM